MSASRDEDLEDAAGPGGAPSAGPGVAREARPPRLSGKATAGLLLACLALAAAVALPLSRRLPLWIRFETALAAWWLIWVVALSRILYRAATVADDHMLGPPRWWFARRDRALTGTRDSRSGWWGFLDWLSLPLDFEGCGWALLILVGLVVLVLVLWLLVELVVPVLAFAAYALLQGMLAAAARFGDRCRGRIGAALGWAMAFATAYVAPLAGAVWLGHVLRAARIG